MVSEAKFNRGMAVIDFINKQMECGEDTSFYSCETFYSTNRTCSLCPMYTNHSIGHQNVGQQCALILLRETAIFIKKQSELVGV
jgi:hypothetical protein